MAQAIKDPQELVDILQLSPTLLPAARRLAQQFPLRVPHSFVQRMQVGNPRDPLLLQILPLHAEFCSPEEYSYDPLTELDKVATPGLIYKYPGRVLLTLTGACPIHCRYCFRRHFPYAQFSLNRDWGNTLAYLENRTDISEVILSGGEPLSLDDEILQGLLLDLSKLPHIRRIRIHTRMLVVIPQRLTATLLNILSSSRFNFVVVIHVNHANEINTEVKTVCKQLQQIGVTLFNQTVLLRRINDDASRLTQLCETLFNTGVIPYYLHMLDSVRGAAHFCISEQKALSLTQQLRAQLPGYMVPTLVREQAGKNSKTPMEETNPS